MFGFAWCGCVFSLTFPDSGAESRRLKSGDPFLLEQSHELANEDRCVKLAEILLKNYPGGGKQFIDSKVATGGFPNWQIIAHDILMAWCETQPECATKDNLIAVLNHIKATTNQV